MQTFDLKAKMLVETFAPSIKFEGWSSTAPDSLDQCAAVVSIVFRALAARRGEILQYKMTRRLTAE